MTRYLILIFCMGIAACSGKPAPKTATPDSTATEPAPQIAEITPDSAKAAGIETAVAGPAEIRETITLYGSIRPNAERQQEVRARYPGIVRTVAKRPGDAVAKGELLLSIESNDSLEAYSIRSPIAGTVLQRRVNPGETVDGSTTLLVVADLSNVWAEFAVFGRDIGRVRAGMTVLLRSSDGQTAGTAKIAYVAPSGSGDTQSVVARAVVDNMGGQWIAGQFVTGDVVVDDLRVPVSVVPDALQTLDDDAVVFVQTSKGFEPCKVETGKRSTEAVEIKRGLAAGERYATKNSYTIKSELLKGSGDEE
ncbi:MAG: efflux RND transporter periplasmic adaptor subunit [Stenotrophobium sp.]